MNAMQLYDDIHVSIYVCFVTVIMIVGSLPGIVLC